MNITTEQAKKIVLYDNPTENGGTSKENETLYEFLMEMLPYKEDAEMNIDIDKVNSMLEECGIQSVLLDRNWTQIKICDEVKD